MKTSREFGGSEDKAAGLGSMGGFGTKIRNDSHDGGNTAEAQRARTLAALRLGPKTTLDLRRCYDILHPAGRVMELRKTGRHIQTFWVDDVTSEGRTHRVARYVLMLKGDA